MRVLSVGFMSFIFAGVVLWLCFGFVSGVWAPMAWVGPGRALFVLALLCVALPAGICGGMCYEEHLARLRKGK